MCNKCQNLINWIKNVFVLKNKFTVLPAKSDSDVIFVHKVIRDIESIAHLCINPFSRIGLIHK